MTAQRLVPALDALWQGCALLAAIQLPGAIFDYVIRSDVGPPTVLTAAVAVLAALSLLAHRVTSGTWRTRRRPVAAAAVGFGLAALFAQLAPALMRGVFVEAGPDIILPAPGRRLEDCRGRPQRCHEHVLNELGFRGRLGRRNAPDDRLVAFIGDSFIFGSGVGDEDTVPAVAARELSELRPPVAVVNAGVEGLAAGNFPRVIRYVRERLNPDVLVVLLKDDDLDDTDMLSRWNRFRRSFWFRLLYVVNVEPAYETARQAWRLMWGQRGNRERLVGDLDAIAAAAAGATLLLVVDLTEELQPEFDAWLAAHPDALSVSSWQHPGFERAERIPDDGHWNESGCREIALMMLPALRASLSVASASNLAPAT